MFSAKDVKEIIAGFGSSLVFQNAEFANSKDSARCRLVHSRFNETLISLPYLDEQFRVIIARGRGRLQVGQVARQLDISTEVFRQLFLRRHDTRYGQNDEEILTGQVAAERLAYMHTTFIDQRVCRSELSSILKNIQRECDQQPLFVNDLCFRYHLSVENFDSIVRGYHLDPHEGSAETPPDFVLITENDSQKSSRWITSRNTYEGLRSKMIEDMERASIESRKISLIPSAKLMGPEVTLLQKMADDILKEPITRSPGSLVIVEGQLTFTPHSFHILEVQSRLKSVACGDLNILNIQLETSTCPNLFDRTSIERLVKEHGEDITYKEPYAISSAWIGRISTACEQDILSDGFSFPQVRLLSYQTSGDARLLTSSKHPPDKVPQDAFENLIFPLIQAKVQSRLPKSECFKGVFMEGDFVSHQKEMLKIKVRQISKEALNANIGIFEPKLVPNLQGLCETPNETKSPGGHDQRFDVKGSQLILEHYLGEFEQIFRDEQDKGLKAIEDDFAAYWNDKVEAQFALYYSGVEHCPDDKLRQQLQALLHNHLISELIPDHLGKAEAKGLLRTKRTCRNVERLQTALMPRAGHDMNDTDMQNAIEGLKKFAARQNVPLMSEHDLAKRKADHIHEIVRRMEKDANAPRLFLTLVTVLWGKRKNGLIYATGKFAPRLLKVMRDELDVQTYAELETLKNAVKQGSTSAEQMQKIRVLASKD